MAIYDLFLSRNNGPTIADYVGHTGRLFYDPAERVLRISNGSTAGGEVFNGLVTVANTEPTANFQGQLWLNPQTSELSVYHNGDFIPTIDVATTTKLGGIKLGPGVTLNGDGQLIIDSAGLDFSFGDLASTTGTYPADYYQAARQDLDYAILRSVNDDEDIVFASNGTGAVRVVGDFSVRRANGSLNGALSEEPIFSVSSDGQVQMLVPSADSSEGAFTIVGGLDGVFQAPVNTGVMMHITGIASSPDPTPSRIYNDAQNSFSAIVSRRYNGTAAAPTAVSDGEEIMRLSGTAHNGTIIPGTGNQRIIYKALGNQTLTNQGGTMEFWTTPVNTTTIAKVATVSSTGITLESGKVLTGNVTGDVTGDVTGNVSGTAATVTTAAQPAITSVGTLTNLDIATGGTITTPRVIINDGGIRTISGGTTCTINFATDSIILWTAPSGTANITLSNYTAGARVKLIIALTTSRDITFGVAGNAYSSTGSDNWNGTGGGAVIDIANTAVHLDYTCITALATGCYVAVTAN
jgi:hypothetical protein